MSGSFSRPTGAGRRGSRTGGGFSEPPADGAQPPADGAAVGDGRDPTEVARSIALRMLAAAPRSRAQLAEAMARKDVPVEAAEAVLDRFTEVGLIDDAELARLVVRSRHSERGLSRRAIGVELRRRGIDDESIDVALTEVDDDQEEAAARTLVRRRLAATRGLDPQVRSRRTYAALGRKGYGGELISRLVREELNAEGVDADPMDLGSL